MRCIFCKQATSNSKSIEHIIPESLGNTEYILPIGIVCDKCNNYIAREVEKPFLDSLYIRERRFYASMTNKKDRIPPLDGFHPQSLTPIQLIKLPDEKQISVGAAPDVDETRWIASFHKNKKGDLVFPIGEKPSDYIISRFIGKIGLEVLAHRTSNIPGAIDEIIDKPELDELRQYVRIGKPQNVWPISFRPIYPPDFLFNDSNEDYTIAHEFDILITDQGEHYVVVVIFGDEYVLNLGGPEIEGYERWLQMNNNLSPLYSGKNLKN